MLKKYVLCGVFGWIFSYFATRAILGVESGNNFSEEGYLVYITLMLMSITCMCICVRLNDKFNISHKKCKELEQTLKFSNESSVDYGVIKAKDEEIKQLNDLIKILMNKK